jgi:hypothetical protein
VLFCNAYLFNNSIKSREMEVRSSHVIERQEPLYKVHAGARQRETHMVRES